MLIQHLAQLREDHLHALLERLTVRLLHRHRPLEVVEQRQEIREQILRDDSGEFLLLLRRAAAEIFKIRLKTKDAVTLFLELCLKRGSVILCGDILHRHLCGLRLRFGCFLHGLLCRLLRHLFLFLQTVHLSYHLS